MSLQTPPPQGDGPHDDGYTYFTENGKRFRTLTKDYNKDKQTPLYNNPLQYPNDYPNMSSKSPESNETVESNHLPPNSINT